MAELEEGRVIGSYRVVRCIGQGGMGTVYEVEHVELGVHYALKTFTFPDDAKHAAILRQKFFEEGKVLARLSGPHLVRVFDLAIDEATGVPYFVMDLVTYSDGNPYSLSDLMDAEIDEDVIFGWFKDACETLDYVHAQGIVHRDIKPSNLMLNAEHHVVLADFGVSKIFGSHLHDAVMRGQTEVGDSEREQLIMGTRGYMAPEVEDGEDATPAADIYSLGMTFLALLTKGKEFENSSEALAALSAAPRKYRWNAILPQLIASRAARRPTKLVPLLRTLDPRILEREAKQAQAAARNRRNRNLAAFGIAATILAILIGAGVTWGVNEYRSRQLAESKQKAAQEAAAKQAEFEKQIDALTEQQKEELRKLRDDGRISPAEVEKRIKDALAEAAAVATTNKPPKSSTKPVPSAKPQTPPNSAVTTLPKPPASKPEMVIVKDWHDEADEEKDYGPIPNVKYKWFAGQGNENPLRVDFQMSSGAKIEMLPMKKGVFYMSNNWDDKKARHKVTLTRPFWMSKFCVTAAQWREFDEGYVADCLPIEKALEGKYPVSKAVTRPQFDAFCKFMTQKYKKQLPEGYVFRLPTDAEFEWAYDEEGTRSLYGQQYGEKIWAASKETCSLFTRVSRECNLMQFGKWEGHGILQDSHAIRIGGLNKPHASGVIDMTHTQNLLDTLPANSMLSKFHYADEEVDPLRYTAEKDRTYLHRWWNQLGKNEGYTAHLVLGPDLIKEKAWNNPRVNIEHNVPVPNRRYAWTNSDKVPRMIKKPKELTFKMAEGGDMIFCTIPQVKNFNMSNPDGQEKLYHKVTLTKPFWITKYCVTTKQWREYAKYDCEGIVREVEKYFPRNPIYMPFTRPQWDGFCEYLNKRYGHQLPKGYVFRLPTEAEWEWAFVGDKDESIRAMPRQRFDPWDERFKMEFGKLIKKLRIPKSLPFNPSGQIDSIKIGGRVDCTDTFGVCDMFNANILLFDTYDADGIEKDGSLDWDGFHIGDYYSCYDDCEIDPVNYAGKLATRTLRRIYHRHIMDGLDYHAYAHIIVGPDIETTLKKKELEPYPIEDFGGKLLSNVITHGGQSSRAGDERNSRERFDRMLSTENTIVAVLDENKDLRGFFTNSEDSPWIQLDLNKRYLITGLQIDALPTWMCNQSRHLRVWTSEDGKKWREVAAENQRKHRYRFDLQRKNVKAKYIRIGREPGFMKDYFSLDKILIYGKEK